MPGSALGASDTSVNKTDKVSALRSLHSPKLENFTVNISIVYKLII